VTEAGPPARLAIVVTPFARADVVAAACAQLGMRDAIAVPAKTGVIVTRPLPAKVAHTDWDISELFGESPSTSPDDDARPGAPAASGEDLGRAAGGEPDAVDVGGDAPGPSARAGEELATAMSTITERGIVLVTADLGVDTGPETGLAGHVTAREWTAGEPGDDVPPGLLLANADEVLEDIVLGRRAPDEIAGAIRASDVTGRGKKRRLFGKEKEGP
jgi:hypothetical protein